jgi:hypothetical protein
MLQQKYGLMDAGKFKKMVLKSGKKGHWICEERSFQRQSELLKAKTTNRPKA